MPQCFIDDTYQDECIIDPRDGKLRHCSVCEAVIQDLRDDYEKADQKKRFGSDLEEFDFLDLDIFVAEELPMITVSHRYLAEEYEPID